MLQRWQRRISSASHFWCTKLELCNFSAVIEQTNGALDVWAIHHLYRCVQHCIWGRGGNTPNILRQWWGSQVGYNNDEGQRNLKGPAEDRTLLPYRLSCIVYQHQQYHSGELQGHYFIWKLSLPTSCRLVLSYELRPLSPPPYTQGRVAAGRGKR